MKQTERVVIVVILLFLVAGSAWAVYSVQRERADFRARVAAGEFERPLTDTTPSLTDQSDWRRYYPVTHPIVVGGVALQASIADTSDERILGLSNTPYLPVDVVKLFAFGAPGSHSIWMKNMNYPLDILWADESGVIVHIVENASPATYDSVNEKNSQSFSSPIPAWYVLEANAGFVATNDIVLGDKIILPR